MPIPRAKVVRALGLDSAAVHVICLKWKVDRGSVTSCAWGPELSSVEPYLGNALGMVGEKSQCHEPRWAARMVVRAEQKSQHRQVLGIPPKARQVPTGIQHAESRDQKFLDDLRS